MAPREMTRSPSASTLSCITVCDIACDTSSAVLSTTTPPTSNADDASHASTDATIKPEATSWFETTSCARHVERDSNRSGSMDYRRDRPQTSDEGGSRTVSGETLVDRGDGAEQQLVQDSIQILDLDWNVDSMPGDDMKKGRPAEQLKRRRSTRLEVLERATSVVNATSTALGKRGRDAMNAGREKLHAIKLDRRASLRPRGSAAQGEEGFERPLKKRARLGDDNLAIAPAVVSTSPRKASSKPRVKRWLSQGLYLGQDRDFDPRLTDTKNKLKRASRASEVTIENKVLPLPMFGGQRLLDFGRHFKLPFQVFSPLPPGQPKPEEWKKTQKSRSSSQAECLFC